MRQQYLEAPGGQVEFGVEGSGPPILYFHGTPCGNELVVTMERTLVEAGFQLIIPNRPGFYGTPLNDRTTTSDCADLAANVLRHLGVARVAVIGTSAGGPPALAFAVRYPQLTAALVLQCAQTHRWDDRRWAPSAHPWQYRLFRHIPSRWLFCKFYRTLFRLGFPTARNYLEDLTGSRFAELKNDPAVWQLGASVYQTVKQHQFHRRGLYNDVSTWLRENVLSTGEVA